MTVSLISPEQIINQMPINGFGSPGSPPDVYADNRVVPSPSNQFCDSSSGSFSMSSPACQYSDFEKNDQLMKEEPNDSYFTTPMNPPQQPYQAYVMSEPQHTQIFPVGGLKLEGHAGMIETLSTESYAGQDINTPYAADSYNYSQTNLKNQNMGEVMNQINLPATPPYNGSEVRSPRPNLDQDQEQAYIGFPNNYVAPSPTESLVDANDIKLEDIAESASFERFTSSNQMLLEIISSTGISHCEY